MTQHQIQGVSSRKKQTCKLIEGPLWSYKSPATLLSKFGGCGVSDKQQTGNRVTLCQGATLQLLRWKLDCAAVEGAT